MDAPPIRYTTTSDGVSIAYTRFGNGPTVVLAPPAPFTDLGEMWAHDVGQQLLALAQDFELITYDHRGHGLSSRDHTTFFLSDLLRDLEAVVTASSPPPSYTLASYGGIGSQVALNFVLAHPGVERLVLTDPVAKSADTRANMSALFTLMDQGASHETVVRTMLGWSQQSRPIPLTLTMNAASPEAWRAMFGDWAHDEWNVEDELPGVGTATTVLAGAVHWHEGSAPRRIVERIPGAELIQYASPDEYWRVLRKALSGAGQSATDSGPFRTILFTDDVASTPLLAQLKDERMRAVMRDHDAVLQAAVDEHDGRVVKTIGDAFMADFAVPSAAVDCAIAMQRGIRDQFAGSDVPIRLRIGINAGEPIAEDDDLHGASVVIAKRLESAAPTDGILIADGVKQLLAGKDFSFTDQGAIALKGFDDPVRAWAVDWNVP